MSTTTIYLIIGSFILLYYWIKLTRKGRIKKLLNGDVIVIDVRTSQEFNSGHFPQSINIPLHTIEDEISTIQAYNKDVIVVCASGIRSEKAKNILIGKGISCHNGGSWKFL